MGMFDMSSTKGVNTTVKNALNSGIHDATFKGIKLETLTGRDGEDYDVMALIFDIEGYGEFKHNMFEPTSSERSTSSWGAENPSQSESFMVTLKHIIDALVPKVSKGIDDGTVDLSAPNFRKFVKLISEHTEDAIGNKVQLKLLPNKSGYANIPGFPVKISKDGNVYLSTSFIGSDLTLSPYELGVINKAKEAKSAASARPAMPKVDGDDSDILTDSDLDDDDLPF